MKLENKPGIDALNCGEGHLEIRFDITNAIETENAKRTIVDMLRRGYALFLPTVEGGLVRVKNFDEKQGCYIIGAGATVLDPDDNPIVEDDVAAKPA